MLDLLHPKNKAWIEQFSQQPHHALIITLNHQIEYQPILRIMGKVLESKNVIELNDDNAVSIETVREMQRIAKLRKSLSEKHIFVFNVALGISREAQNSLLKILEEPPTGTFIFLIAGADTPLLPTIYSRSQQLQILPLPFEQFRHLHDGSEGTLRALSAAYNSSFALQEADDDTPFATVREFLGAPLSRRLKTIQTLKKRDEALDFVQRLSQLAFFTQHHTAKQQKTETTKRWIIITEATVRANEALIANGNVTLQLQRLALTIPTIK